MWYAGQTTRWRRPCGIQYRLQKLGIEIRQGNRKIPPQLLVSLKQNFKYNYKFLYVYSLTLPTAEPQSFFLLQLSNAFLTKFNKVQSFHQLNTFIQTPEANFSHSERFKHIGYGERHTNGNVYVGMELEYTLLKK